MFTSQVDPVRDETTEEHSTVHSHINTRTQSASLRAANGYLLVGV